MVSDDPIGLLALSTSSSCDNWLLIGFFLFFMIRFPHFLFYFLIFILVGCSTVPVVTKSGAANTQPSASIEPPAPPQVAASKSVPKLGLALGGGAARGFAHVGVIQVLEEAGIAPSLVVGTSAGSMVAAFYASGKTGAQLQRLSETMDEASLTDWNVPLISRGMMRGDALARYVSQQVAGKKIEDLKMPLGIVATELRTGEGVLFRRGDIATAVRASSAVPSVFDPVRIGGFDYVDGGLVAPVPVRYAKQMGADIVLAIDISSAPEDNPASDILKVLLQTFSIMGKSINQYELAQADVVVRPSLSGVGSAEFAARRRSIEAGRAAMKLALPKLLQALQR